MTPSQIGTTKNPFPLKGRLAIVTSVTNIIGQAAAYYLSSKGASASVALVSSTKSTEAASIAEFINFSSSASIPRRAIRIRADVTDPVAVHTVFNTTEKTFKCRPNIVFHSAGIHVPSYDSFSSTTLFKFQSLMSANVRNSFYLLREAANRVERDGGGRIFAVSSGLVETNRPGYCAFTASKAALEAMVKTLVNEFLEKKIRITAVFHRG